MVLRILSPGAIAALVGGAMFVAASSSPSPAFTLSSSLGEQPVHNAGIQEAYWHHWGWHHWHHWGWRHHWHHWY
jgi:hypothetical protein